MATESKHTPGPWVVEPDNTKQTFAVRAGRGPEGHIEGVAHVYAKGGPVYNKRQELTGFDRPEEAAANANLIAAAPEVALMLKEVLYHMPQEPFELRDPRHSIWPKIVEAARAALAKAGVA